MCDDGSGHKFQYGSSVRVTKEKTKMDDKRMKSSLFGTGGYSFPQMENIVMGK